MRTTSMIFRRIEYKVWAEFDAYEWFNLNNINCLLVVGNTAVEVYITFNSCYFRKYIYNIGTTGIKVNKLRDMIVKIN